MKKFRTSLPLADYWRPATVVTLAAAAVLALLLVRLNALLPGISAQEGAFSQQAKSVSVIIENPLYLANKVAAFLFTKIGVPGFDPRLVSALIGFASVAALFIILRYWHTTRVAVFATLLYVCSSWFLNVARLGTTDSAYLLPILLLLGGIWLQRKRHVVLASLITLLSALLLLYVPAMVWLVIPAIIWQRRRLRAALVHVPIPWQAIIFVLGLVGLTPLIWAFIQQPELIRTWLGLPNVLPQPTEYLRNILQVPVDIFARREVSPEYGIANLPYVDVFTSVMVAFGVYAYAFRLKLDRTKFILASALIGTLMVAVNGPVRISILLPFVYMFAAAGIALLLQKWFTVFPKNPLARSVAVVLMFAAIVVSCSYHLSRYYEAWPNTPATKNTFQQQP